MFLLFKKQIFYDTDCFFTFLVIDKVFILKKLFKEINIPKPAYDELILLCNDPMLKKSFNDIISSGFVKIINMDIFSEEYTKYKCIKNGYWDNFKVVGKGEAAALSYAIVNDGIIASNNLSDVKSYVKKFNLTLLTSSMIIAISFENQIITEKEANSIWNDMLNKKRKLPANSFLEYYKYIFPNDSQQYLKNIS